MKQDESVQQRKNLCDPLIDSWFLFREHRTYGSQNDRLAEIFVFCCTSFLRICQQQEEQKLRHQRNFFKYILCSSLIPYSESSYDSTSNSVEKSEGRRDGSKDKCTLKNPAGKFTCKHRGHSCVALRFTFWLTIHILWWLITKFSTREVHNINILRRPFDDFK